MKTLLLPVDFSQASDNATRYAVELSKFMRARLVLLHVFYIPVVAADAAIVVPASGDMEKYAMQRLKEIREVILQQKDYIPDVECVCVSGFAVEEIGRYAGTCKADLIVMGMQGAGALAEKFIGSVTTSVLRTSSCPVMVIDREVSFKPLEKIVLACDYKRIPKSRLWPLKDLARLFDAHVFILHVVDEALREEIDLDVALQDLQIDDSFRQLDYSLHFVTARDVVEGINKYVDRMGIDLVVMIPRKTSLLERLFTEPDTKRMAFHTHVPLLTLHE